MQVKLGRVTPSHTPVAVAHAGHVGPDDPGHTYSRTHPSHITTQMESRNEVQPDKAWDIAPNRSHLQRLQMLLASVRSPEPVGVPIGSARTCGPPKRSHGCRASRYCT
jgi:hypothetical protein